MLANMPKRQPEMWATQKQGVSTFAHLSSSDDRVLATTKQHHGGWTPVEKIYKYERLFMATTPSRSPKGYEETESISKYIIKDYNPPYWSVLAVSRSHPT
jgi:hypothetical protein